MPSPCHPTAHHCCPPAHPDLQVLQLKDERGRLLAVLDDDSRKLGYYSPQDGFTLHIIDTDPTSLSGAAAQCAAWAGMAGGQHAILAGGQLVGQVTLHGCACCPDPCPPTWPQPPAANGWLEDVSKVDKYVMSDEAYAARDNTYRK